MTLVGTVGETAIVPPSLKGWNTARAVAVIPVRPDVDPRWVQCILSTTYAREFVKARLNTTVQATLNLRDVAALPVSLPERAIRSAILDIVGVLDDKIELNRRMNETLEEMARALFKSWFVDFDPVHAKAAGKKPFGMDEVTSSRFPSYFENSELGKIPAGWSVTTLANYVSLVRGTTYKSELLGAPGPYLLGLASIHRNGGFRGDKLRTYGGESPDKLLLRPGDLYVSLKDVTQAGDLVGAVARVPGSISTGRLTQDTVRLALIDQSVPSAYIYWMLRDERCREYCRARAIGTTNLSLARDDFLAFPVPRPDDATLVAFAETEREVIRRHELNNSQAATLSIVRDVLLPKLLSGELRIKDAERIVGKVT